MAVATPPKTTFEPDAKRYTDEELTKMLEAPAARSAADEAAMTERMTTYRAQTRPAHQAQRDADERRCRRRAQHPRRLHGTFFTSNGAPTPPMLSPCCPKLKCRPRTSCGLFGW